MTTELWRSPAGYLHYSRYCSAGAGRRMKRVRIEDQDLAKMTWPQQICRCALRSRDKAKERMTP
jgi:hypothetical protein